MKWKRIEKEFEQMKALFGIKNRNVRLVTPKEFNEISGYSLGSFWGRADTRKEVITVKRNRSLRRIRHTIAHELAHLLFPTKPHWWIECFAYRIVPVKNEYGRYGRYTRRYGHSYRELPSKTRLIEIANRAAKRLDLQKEVNE